MEELAAGLSRVGIQDAIMLPSDEELFTMVQALEKKSEGGNYTTVTGAYRRLVEEGLIPNAHDDRRTLCSSSEASNPPDLIYMAIIDAVPSLFMI